MFIYLYWWYSYISVIKIPFGGFRFTSILVSSIVLFAVLAKIASRKELGYYIELGNILFDSLYINKERPINIVCKMNISKSTYYDMKEKLIFKVSEIIYPKFIRDMYDSYLF